MGTLPRHLGVATVTALVIGEVIAIGIFLTPATMARSVGSPLWLLVVWLVMGAILILAALSVVGIRFGARVMQWLTALKLGALGLIAVLALALGAGSWSHFIPFVAQRPGSDPLPGALAPALVGAFFAFGGWWEIAKLGGEARDPART